MTFSAIEFIDAKRLGKTHSQPELAAFIQGVLTGTVPDYQLAAWLMAVCCNGLNTDEAVWLTQLYIESGETLNWDAVKGVVADKHSTGGVGDKTTLVLAPLLASCGLRIAKLSGRGLGFTGGTVDKLEAIPGFRTALTPAQMIQQVNDIGIALGAQTQDLAPADGKIYALRDVTATVASIPLIAASVMSKKIAAGANVIMLDIKVGSGAFMKSRTEAEALADLCREIGRRLGRSVSTLISEMNQPLGFAIGHTVEVLEAIDTLKGCGPKDLTQLCLTLGSTMLNDAGLSQNVEEAQSKLTDAITSGRALYKFSEWIVAQGADKHVVDNPKNYLPMPGKRVTMPAHQTGTVRQCDALKLAQAAKLLGAGRATKNAAIDYSVGLILHKKIGDPVKNLDPLAELWVKNEGSLHEQSYKEAQHLIYDAFAILPDFTG